MKTILVVDDEPTLVATLKYNLERDGHRILTAADGESALLAAREGHPDLIVLDLMMPVMNGFDFVRELRKNTEWQDIPVVILTAKDLTGDDRQQLKGNVERILQKGDYNREQLLNEVRELVKTSIRKQPEARS